MWSSRLFWKLLAAFLALHVASTVALIYVADRAERKVLEEQLLVRLENAAVMLRAQTVDGLVSGKSDAFGPLAKDVGEETGLRITILDSLGRVLADSSTSTDEIDNHHERPEILEALRTGRGAERRHSMTLDEDLYYVAHRVDGPQGVVGFVRVALPVVRVNERVAESRRAILWVAGAISLLALVVIAAVVARIIAPVAALTNAAKAIASGELVQSVSVSNRDELGRLGEAFNHMGHQLQVRINELRDNGQRLATVLGSMVEGVIAVDDHQRILLANDAARVLLGVAATNLSGRPLWEVVRNRSVGQTVEDALDGMGPSRGEFEVVGPPRRLVAIHATSLPGAPCPGVVLVLHDVTELRRLENLRQDFVANVSHELKTPLSSIKAYAETLLGGAIHDQENNVVFLRRIEEQAERLHVLILDMLSLARIETGREAFEIGPVPLERVSNASITQHQAKAVAKRIELTTEPSPSSISVRADEDGVRTILDNLIDNAIKYTPEGGRVTLRWELEIATARVEVRDTGIGIAKVDQARIFERFYRVDKARSRELGGTGLGLSIVKHLVQAFGGTVSVSSEIGSGSTFCVRLPLA
jgi:two-component system phosphate regulon sensor histidine kinase PhoR